MQQVEIVTPAGSQHFQPQNQFESYHAATVADGTVDVVLSIATGDGSPDQQNVVASLPAEQVQGVIESSNG